MSDPQHQSGRAGNADERRAIGFLIAKVAVFILVPLLASAIAVYVML